MVFLCLLRVFNSFATLKTFYYFYIKRSNIENNINAAKTAIYLWCVQKKPFKTLILLRENIKIQKYHTKRLRKYPNKNAFKKEIQTHNHYRDVQKAAIMEINHP